MKSCCGKERGVVSQVKPHKFITHRLPNGIFQTGSGSQLPRQLDSFLVIVEVDFMYEAVHISGWTQMTTNSQQNTAIDGEIVNTPTSTNQLLPLLHLLSLLPCNYPLFQNVIGKRIGQKILVRCFPLQTGRILNLSPEIIELSRKYLKLWYWAPVTLKPEMRSQEEEIRQGKDI